MRKIQCACGCGTPIPPLTTDGRPARFAHGHNRNPATQFKKGHLAWNAGKPNPAASLVHKGKKLATEEIARRTATRLARNGGRYTSIDARGWRHPPETLAKITAANRRNAKPGALNPFYGKQHPPEIIERIRVKNSGPNHHGWRGGVSTFPYGPEFTRQLKRRILDRDQHTCQRCGKTQAELPRKLQVHHLDHDKKNNAESNLVAACCKCNIWASYHRDAPFVAAA